MPRQDLSYNKFQVLPSGWDEVWIKAKRDCQTTPKNILFLGDSFAIGVGATDLMPNSTIARFKAKLVSAGLPINGDFWHVGQSLSWDASFTGMATAPPWVFNVAPAWATGFGYGICPVYSGVNTGQITFTTPYACTAFDIIGLEFVAGTYTYSIDGGGAQTVTTTALNFHRRVSVTGLANTTHTIVFNPSQSATNVMIVLGIITYASTTTGMCISRVAYSGASIANFGYRGGGLIPDDKLKLWQGNLTPAGNNVGFGFPTQPSLCIIALGLNDCQIMTGEDQYLSFLRRTCQAARRGVADCSILCLINSLPDGVSSDVTPGLANPQNYLSYMDGMRQVAASFNAAVVNVHAAWADQGFAMGMEAAGSAHPLNAGHQDIANRLAAALGL